MPDPIIIDEPKQERYSEYMRRRMREEDEKMVSNEYLESPINGIQQLMAITAEEWRTNTGVYENYAQV